jgi:hypothetical protein
MVCLNAPKSAAREPLGKLRDASAILSQFEQGQERVKVIVNLVEPEEMRAKTDWDSPQSLKQLQSRILAIQTETLMALHEGDLVLRCLFENQAGFSAEATLDALARLEADPRVLSIQAVRPLKRFLKDAVPHLKANTYRSIYDGRGVAIAICDDGFDYYHPKLGGAPLGHNAKVIDGYDFGDDDPDPYYDGDASLDHGTKCAGAAAGDLGTSGDYLGGIAPGAKLYLLKIWDRYGSVDSDRLILAWNWCLTHKNDDPGHPNSCHQHQSGRGPVQSGRGRPRAGRGPGGSQHHGGRHCGLCRQRQRGLLRWGGVAGVPEQCDLGRGGV